MRILTRLVGLAYGLLALVSTLGLLLWAFVGVILVLKRGPEVVMAGLFLPYLAGCVGAASLVAATILLWTDSPRGRPASALAALTCLVAVWLEAMDSSLRIPTLVVGFSGLALAILLGFFPLSVTPPVSRSPAPGDRGSSRWQTPLAIGLALLFGGLPEWWSRGMPGWAWMKARMESAPSPPAAPVNEAPPSGQQYGSRQEVQRILLELRDPARGPPGGSRAWEEAFITFPDEHWCDLESDVTKVMVERAGPSGLARRYLEESAGPDRDRVDAATVRRIEWLAAKGMSLEERDAAGRTLLGLATVLRQSRVAEWLIYRGAPLDSPDSGGETPLDAAALTGQLGLVQILVSRGARGDAAPLHAAHLAGLAGVSSSVHARIRDHLGEKKRGLYATNVRTFDPVPPGVQQLEKRLQEGQYIDLTLAVRRYVPSVTPWTRFLFVEAAPDAAEPGMQELVDSVPGRPQGHLVILRPDGTAARIQEPGEFRALPVVLETAEAALAWLRFLEDPSSCADLPADRGLLYRRSRTLRFLSVPGGPGADPSGPGADSLGLPSPSIEPLGGPQGLGQGGFRLITFGTPTPASENAEHLVDLIRIEEVVTRDGSYTRLETPVTGSRVFLGRRAQ